MAATGSISGTVTGAGGAPLSEIHVCAKASGSVFGFPICASTNPNGEYSLASLAEGDYLVQFEGKGEYLRQWYDGVEPEAEASPVTVTGGAAVTGIDAELVKGAAVEGTITDATSGAPLADIRACVSAANGNPIGAGCATSDSGGHYRIIGVPAGEYKLRLEPVATDSDYLSQFWPSGQIFAAGTALHLSNGATKAGVDATMRIGGSLSGKVVDENGEPVEGLSVCTYPVLADTNVSYCFENTTETASDGTYTLHGLYSGEYKISFRGYTGNYLPQWFDDQATRRGAAAVTVTAPGAVTGIDATLHSGGVIAGTLRKPGHEPFPYGTICAELVDSTYSRCAQAKADGGYRIEALRSGEYQVEFGSPNNGADGPYLPVFYGGSATRDGATPIAVTAGHEVEGIDGELEEGGTIGGRITDAVSHEPAQGIEACAYVGGATAGHCDTSNNEGEYGIIGLPAGSYAVRFVPALGGPLQNFRTGDPHYLRQFYADAATEAAATPITAGPGIAATGKDVEMHAGGGISGTITGPLGEPLPYADACTVESATDPGGHCSFTDAGGDYEIAGLYPGSYTVLFRPGGLAQHELASEYFHGVLNFDEAEPVTVTGTAVTEHVDAQLVRGGTIEGTVVDNFDGTPVAGAKVCAKTAGGQFSNCAESQVDGHYAMPVPPGSYKVEFSLGYEEEEDEEAGPMVEVEEFITQYFDGAASAGSASMVTVAGGATVTGIDAALEPAPTRSNTVAVALVGQGAGAITSSPAGIDCGTTCSDSFETRKTVTLHADPAPGSTFTGWAGACSGTGPCQIRLTAAASVAATFEPSAASSTPPPSSPPQTLPAHPKPKRECKKGYKRKHSRCVKVKKPRKHHKRRHHAKRH